MSFPRTLVTFLLALLALLAFASPAQAKVSIVPGAARGGDTATFAFRLANQQTATNSTRLEIVIPQDKNIAFAEVAPVRGWTANITARPLAQPMRSGDKTITEVVDSIVLQGGSVGPGQFEQFLITLGPLPAEGMLSFEATQTYAGGRVEKWTGANAPSISLTPAGAADAPPVIADSNNGNDSGEPEVAAAGRAGSGSEGSGFPALALMWGALGLAILIVAVVGIRARLRAQQPPAPEAEDEEVSEVLRK
ncbi:DUF1775 domain-containing protein [Amycolatopsis sp. K13G38]|uniref:DUF1775 domain-containing protein n=1 Tax=Amycolatopsis acididurans TaxID=2724524 RepID=A0ABX1JG10_9PSEU|nr:DUF1775 domain-containing protein [Amycolatopsis acididurans]NKQ57451.1 DUF1775 domain-containing protein [Amycolatopsis acididurans]